MGRNKPKNKGKVDNDNDNSANNSNQPRKQQSGPVPQKHNEQKNPANSQAFASGTQRPSPVAQNASESEKSNPINPQEGQKRSQQQQNQTQSSTSKQMSELTVSPVSGKSLAMIESSPNGEVYEGTRGRKCILEVNYLEILVKNLLSKAYHYDVEFDPPTPKKMLSRALDTFMETYFQNIHFAFDGRKNFYTNKLLDVKGVILDGEFMKEVKAVLGDRSRDFKVKVKFATEVDMSVLKSYQNPAYQHNDKPSQAIQCLDIVLRTVFKALTANNRATAVGRALYFPTPDPRTGRPMFLGEGHELWLGLFQSAILGRQSLYLNVDVAHKAFPSSISILNVLESFDRNGRCPTRLDRRQEEQLHNYLKMLSISYRPLQGQPLKTFGYNGLVEPANRACFVDEDGTKMTVAAYFQRKKNIVLKYPDLPCLHVGSKVRCIYLPMELCGIPAGQATNKKCTPNTVAAMIRYSATSTDERKQKIKNLLNKINYSQQGSAVQGFGVEVDDSKFQKVEGRVIDPPSLKYKNGNVRPQRGAWNGKAFLETQDTAVPWAIINCDDRTTVQSVVKLKDDIMDGARQQGMNLSNSQGNNDIFSINMMRSRQGDMEAMLEKCLKAGYKLVFVLIIDRNDCYAQVKQAAELKVGILTQCIKSSTVFKMNGRGGPAMTIGNILLKVNAKLNGKNQEVIEPSYQKFNSLNDGVMFLGGDVTHPSPDQRDVPSVVGVSCSYDQVGFRYQCAWRLQSPTKEMIEDLENILTEHLKFYKEKNGKLPGKIFYYRDGVSEGQFAEVLRVEMNAIRAALKTIYGPKKPAEVTFVVVQKRHHTRFFPTSKEFSDGKNNNIPAGTVVDKNIVHPFQYQFFLASHAAIQGVTKPSKYCVLINESKISPDDLQAITYDLCHLYTRCTRSVSYPAPTYYAHLVAARGKQYTIGKRLNMTNLQDDYKRMKIHQSITNNAPMFFV